MLILDLHDIEQAFTVKTSSGTKQVLKYQGNFYTFSKTFTQLQSACQFSRACLDNRVTTVILNQEQPEVWHQVHQPDLVEKLDKIAAANVNQPQQRSTILYVEDSQLEGDRMGQMIQTLGYHYCHISKSIEALSNVVEKKPDLIFLDLIMDVLNGYELCSQIRRISQFKATPIIIVTSRDTIVDRARAKITGATQFTTKPFVYETIKAITSQYLSGDKPEKTTPEQPLKSMVTRPVWQTS